MEHKKLSIRRRRITDLLQQTVQAVVAAVTAATKANDVPIAQVPVVQDSEPVAAVGRAVEAPVAGPIYTAQQQARMAPVLPEGTDTTMHDKDQEG
jgi:hypothetical protein